MDIELNTLSMLNQNTAKFHLATASLVFMCYLIPGLWDALAAVEVPERLFLATPVATKDGAIAYNTQTLKLDGIKDRPLTSYLDTIAPSS